MLVVAFSGAGGGWHGTPTWPPTGQPGRRRRVRAAGWAGFERAASRSCRPGAARDAAARDAAAPGLSRKMSRSEACAAPLASPSPPPPPAAPSMAASSMPFDLSCELVDDRVFQILRNSRRSST